MSRNSSKGAKRAIEMKTLTFYNFYAKRFEKKPGVTDEQILARLAKLEDCFLKNRLLYCPIASCGDSVWVVTRRETGEWHIEETIIHSIFIDYLGNGGYHFKGEKFYQPRNMSSYRIWWFLDYQEAVDRLNILLGNSDEKMKDFMKRCFDKDQLYQDRLLDECERDSVNYLRTSDFKKRAKKSVGQVQKYREENSEN